MGYIYEDDILVPEEPQYHTSWDWLMPVIQKIEEECGGVPKQLLDVSFYDEIGDVYQAVVEFIKQYNNEQHKRMGLDGSSSAKGS